MTLYKNGSEYALTGSAAAQSAAPPSGRMLTCDETLPARTFPRVSSTKGEKRGRESRGEVLGGALKKPRGDFFTPQVVDKDLNDKFHEALIEHITETCSPFAQYGASFQNVINVIGCC